MRRTRSALLVLSLLLVAGGLAANAAGGNGNPLVTSAQVDPDQIVLRVDLHEDGSATWRIEHVVQLDDENTTQAFESLADDIEQNRSEFESRFRDRMLATVRAAENATGREMSIRNVSVRTTRTVTQGKVIYAFEWVGFAATPDERIVAGDAIAGLVLDDRTTLLFQWPSEWSVVEISPDTDRRNSGVAGWSGPMTFASNEPRLVLSTVVSTPSPTATPTPTPTATASPAPGGPTPTTDVTPSATPTPATAGSPPSTDVTPTATATPAPPGRAGGLSPWVVAGTLLFLALLGAGGWLAYRRDDSFPFAIGTAPEKEENDGEDGSAEQGEPPEELLSNEERVLRLLEEHGGRMKQQDVASELDWTDAKTSQVVGNLREEDEIEVFRIGRENVLALPGESEF